MKVLVAILLFALALTLSLRAQQNVFISEFMPDNERILADEDGQFPDWIELQNGGTGPVNLQGWFLTDNASALRKWAFPAVTLPPGGVLVVFASGKNRTNDAARLHTSFQLRAEGGFLALVRPDGTNIASAFSDYPSVKEDVSFGIAQKQTTTALLANSLAQILVPANAGALPVNWNQLAYSPGANWTNGAAPPAVGFDTNLSFAAGTPVNVAASGTAVQSTVNGSFAAALGINNNFGDFTHTLGTDTSPFWQLTLTNEMAIHSVVLFNRTSCCGSRLRDITFQILSTNEAGTVTNFASALLNPENAGFTYPNGPANLSNNLVTLTGGPVFGRILRVYRTPDPDLSGTGGQGNADEAAVLSLGEVQVHATSGASAPYRPFIRTDLEAAMLGTNASAFVRLPFTFAGAADQLTLRVRYDDGFIAYLNGTEIARRNAPAAPAWDSAATADRSPASALAQEIIDLSSALPQLAAGTNLLAVHLLNSGVANGDLLFEPQLTAVGITATTNIFLVNATPGAVNDSDWYVAEVADTRFSVDRGFFEAPFSLTVTSATPGAVIYCSFNGDEPGPGKGFLYTNALTITNTTVLRARAFKAGWKATDVDTVTYLFLGDVIHQAPNWPVDRIPPQYFPATWGANTVDYGMDPNVVSNYTLAQWKEAFTQIPTMSIVTEMRHLFDATTGIYANASGHGEEWERPMSLELLDPTNAVPGRFQENCGLRIRGGASRGSGFRKHSFRVFFRRDYGAGKLNYPLFENEGAPEFETFDLRTSQNYSWPREATRTTGQQDTMVREVFCRETLGAMGQPYRRSRYYHLYLNGQYWGLYETDERPEASYGQTYFGGSKTNYDVVKCGNRGTTPQFITEATDGNLIAFSNLWLMCRAHAANPTLSNYFRILGRNPDGTRNTNMPVMLDVDNLIDYMLGIFFTGDGDATLSNFLANNRPNNWFGMRDRANPEMGFHFFNSDCEHTLGSGSSQVDRTGPFRDVAGSNIGNFTYANPQYLHEDLMWNREYRQRFADHVQRHLFNDGALTLQACTNRFLRKASQINRAIRAYSARWGDAVTEPPYNEMEWQAEINRIVNTWFPPRANIVLAQLRADDLFPGIAAPSFSQLGGAVPAGYNLVIAHTNASGVTYFTTDGSDPRAVGGTVSTSAQAYSNPLTINAPALVRARVLSGTNWSAILEYTFYPPQDLSRLLVTEIMYHPPDAGLVDGDEFEFIELKNAGTNFLNLGGLSFSGINFTFANNTVLAPGQFFVLARNVTAFMNRYPGVAVHGGFTGGLNNAGETITLLHPLGSEVLSVSYGDSTPWPITADGFGFSLVPRNAASNPNDPAQWRASTEIGGSPGRDDPASTVLPVLVNEALSHSEAGVDFIELFNPNPSAVNIGGWFLTDDPNTPKKFRIPDGTTISPLGYLVFTETNFNATPGANGSFALNARGDDVYLFSGDASANLTGYSHGFSFGAAPDGGTFGRYVISTGEEQFPGQIAATPNQPNAGPRIGPVVINEVMYHPDTGGDEFIELKNITTNSVSLFDQARPTNTWKLSGLGFDFPTNVTLGANQVLLVVPANPTVFRAKYGIAPSVQVLGPYTGALQDSGERLELQRPDVPGTNGVAYITVDEVRYNDKAPWPAAADGSGPSLQRKASAAYGNDPANWEAAIATPGAEFIGGQSPGIVVQPQSQIGLIGQDVSFSVVANGPPPLNFKWRFNGADIPDATDSTLALTNLLASQAGNYSVIVFNHGGSAASAVAQLTLRQPPIISAPPTNIFVRPGSNALFSVTASGSGFVSYQWRFNGTNIPGATNATLLITNSQFVNEGAYSVVVTDAVGPTTSAAARLTILVDPLITQHPISQNVVMGAAVTISVTVTNTATLPVGYRLRRNNATLPETFVTLNQRSGFFTITNLQPQFTNYSIVVSNLARVGGIASAPAIFTFVTDSDGDGLPDEWEAAYGLGTNNVADAALDSDGDRMSNAQEYIAGTDPTNPLSFLRIESISVSEGVTLSFGAISNKTYTIQFSDAVNGPWSRLVDLVARATNRTEVIADSTGRTNRFYRVATPQQ